MYLALTLRRPLFLEGEAGVGKTAVARALAAALGTELIRLQCYEGLDVHHAVYEWNYARQLLEVRLLEATDAVDRDRAAPGALQRALSDPPAAAAGAGAARRDGRRCCSSTRSTAPTRSSRATCWSCCRSSESPFPELGTIAAVEPPVVILTSNRTREVHDALKRRCLYQWIDYPSFEKELAIVERAVPQASAALAAQVTAFVQELRTAELYKTPGVSETLDWVAALVALDREAVDARRRSRTRSACCSSPAKTSRRCAAIGCRRCCRGR